MEKTPFDFRIISVEPIDSKTILEATKSSVERAMKYLETHNMVPFATAKECWQYSFHSVALSLKDLKEIDFENMKVIEEKYPSEHEFVYVCDLRLFKPEQEWKKKGIMFSPKMGHYISNIIETYLPQQNASSLVFAGTFGCMTGMYLTVSSAIWDATDIWTIYTQIIEVIKENVSLEELSENEKKQVDTLIENYENFSKNK